MRSSTFSLYRAFGLTLSADCELPLPGAQGNLNSRNISVEITANNIPTIPSSAKRVKHHAWVLGDDLWLDFEVGKFWISQGKYIRYSPPSLQNKVEWQFYLLGAAMVGALVQRGQLPLHAGAFVQEGKAFLFLGHSGAGKSTLAVALDKAGYEVLSDDLSALHVDSKGNIIVSTSYAQAKLASCSPFLSRNTREQFAVGSGNRGKTFVPMTQAKQESYPVAGIFILHFGAKLQLEKTETLRAMKCIIDNTHRRAIYQVMEGVSAHIERCSYLLNQTPVYSVQRPRDYQQLDNSVIALTECATRLVRKNMHHDRKRVS